MGIRSSKRGKTRENTVRNKNNFGFLVFFLKKNKKTEGQFWLIVEIMSDKHFISSKQICLFIIVFVLFSTANKKIRVLKSKLLGLKYSQGFEFYYTSRGRGKKNTINLLLITI